MSATIPRALVTASGIFIPAIKATAQVTLTAASIVIATHQIVSVFLFIIVTELFLTFLVIMYLMTLL